MQGTHPERLVNQELTAAVSTGRGTPKRGTSTTAVMGSLDHRLGSQTWKRVLFAVGLYPRTRQKKKSRSQEVAKYIGFRALPFGKRPCFVENG
jgi:hypothetical protein